VKRGRKKVSYSGSLYLYTSVGRKEEEGWRRFGKGGESYERDTVQREVVVALLAGGEWGEAKTRLGRFKLCLVRTTYRWEALEWGKSAAEGKFNIQGCGRGMDCAVFVFVFVPCLVLTAKSGSIEG
jgi:hypothetical protein